MAIFGWSYSKGQHFMGLHMGVLLHGQWNTYMFHLAKAIGFIAISMPIAATKI